MFRENAFNDCRHCKELYERIEEIP